MGTGADEGVSVAKTDAAISHTTACKAHRCPVFGQERPSKALDRSAYHGFSAPLLLVLLAGVGTAVVLAEHAVDDAPEDASQTSAEPLTEQRLAMAAAHWSMMPTPPWNPSP